MPGNWFDRLLIAALAVGMIVMTALLTLAVFGPDWMVTRAAP
jgi:hypothetical protein